MDTVTVSPKFQIVIPKAIRKSMCIASGQKIQFVQYQQRLELIPLRPMHELRGFLTGIDTHVEREPDRV